MSEMAPGKNVIQFENICGRLLKLFGPAMRDKWLWLPSFNTGLHKSNDVYYSE